jgi:hypothetical protein
MSWTKDNRYGTASAETKPVSKSTMYRWYNKDNRKTNRKSASLKAAA